MPELVGSLWEAVDQEDCSLFLGVRGRRGGEVVDAQFVAGADVLEAGVLGGHVTLRVGHFGRFGIETME